VAGMYENNMLGLNRLIHTLPAGMKRFRPRCETVISKVSNRAPTFAANVLGLRIAVHAFGEVSDLNKQMRGRHSSRSPPPSEAHKFYDQRHASS
jgi:hypothetical protein